MEIKWLQNHGYSFLSKQPLIENNNYGLRPKNRQNKYEVELSTHLVGQYSS